MTTQLTGALRREVVVEGEPYTLTIEQAGFKLVPKGRRKGFQMTWGSLINGEAALATALNASVRRAPVLTLHGTRTSVDAEHASSDAEEREDEHESRRRSR